MMSELRKAAQQARTVLANARDYIYLRETGDVWPEEDQLQEIQGALASLQAALAEPEQPVSIKWTLNGDKHCGYDNWVGETPFGRILVTWKSWKEFPEASVDEFPGDFTAYGKPDDVKDECEAEFRRRLGAAPTPRKPLTDYINAARINGGDSPHMVVEKLQSAIERAHGIGEQA